MKPFENSPETLNGGLFAMAARLTGVSVHASEPAQLDWLAREEARQASSLQSVESIPSLPEVARLNQIITHFGMKPKVFQPAIRRLLQSLKNKGRLPRINNVVDAYNLVSAKYRVCMGAHDCARLSFPVRLDICDGSEKFVALGSVEETPVARGEFAYIDGQNRIICRGDFLQADFGKVNGATTEVLLIAEGSDAVGEEQTRLALQEAAELCLRFGGGTCEYL